ncbi:hypothetical protein SISSUDRAFT_1090039 [Sistotremastrum suecicum HHB10207 ss-3]|uniref:Transposase family Tnp2 protein n=1 Tax=Sistotremastrum suecicum HHB10207 ss-3 TaxID=1314776 RepID=A0A166FKG9_9AGAM|nr:hypothetical protein SISSUDRAFT_1090039 [Sistotremastrum suecicum HHB10207 ss-3]
MSGILQEHLGTIHEENEFSSDEESDWLGQDNNAGQDSQGHQQGFTAQTNPGDAAGEPPDRPEPPIIDISRLADATSLDELKLTWKFIEAIRDASLDDEHSGLNKDQLRRLRNPSVNKVEEELSDPDLRASLDLYISLGNSSGETYTVVRDIWMRRHPEDKILSLDEVKKRAMEITGIQEVAHDMCPNSCCAYTGPLKNAQSCPHCKTSRWDPNKSTAKKKVARQKFHTILLGPQIQALYRDPGGAKAMEYRHSLTEAIRNELKATGDINFQQDFLSGSAYLEACAKGHIKEDDMTLMFSIDGAQLYESKQSDCWIYIWVIMENSPDKRYKKRYVLPGGFIPGPEKPKNVDSFLFPGIHHLAAIQKEGLKIWNAHKQKLVISYLFLLIVNADGPGMTYLNGLVGHQGKMCCRLFCGYTGRLKGSHYYTANLRPLAYDRPGSNHIDVDLRRLHQGDKIAPSVRYAEELEKVIRCRNETQFERVRLETGISKPSLFIGLSPNRILGIPESFFMDLMHLGALNNPTLMMELFTGRMPYDKARDHPCTWPWAVFWGKDNEERWEQHGKAVADARHYLPSSFGRPPRNIQKKINSGYKAWEWQMYLYALGPGLLYDCFPGPLRIYWRNLCKLIYGMRIALQYVISKEECEKGHVAIVEFLEEFEELYYQRMSHRIHFCRPCLHGLTHIFPETDRCGPLGCFSQWVLERLIGDLTSEIRQPSNPYQNLSQRGIRRAVVNALQSMYPPFDRRTQTSRPELPPTQIVESATGFEFLAGKDKRPKKLKQEYVEALESFLSKQTNSTGPTTQPVSLDNLSMRRHGRLKLPNGQVARSRFTESSASRVTRNVKVIISIINSTPLAFVTPYSEPDIALLEDSYNTLWSVYLEDEKLEVIEASKIQSVVAMVPHQTTDTSHQRYFLVEKPTFRVSSFRQDGSDENSSGSDQGSERAE